MAPLISIVIPTHNRPLYFKHALESAVLQNGFHDYEIVVSANGDPAKTREIVQYSFPYDIVKYHETCHDLSILPSWQWALSKAAGDYVLLMADDDCLLPNALESYAKAIKDYNQPDFISVANCWYGHSSITDHRHNALRFDMSWNKKGKFNPQELLAEFFKFGRPTFSPTYSLIRKEIYQTAKGRGISLVNPIYPDYSMQSIALAFAKTAAIMSEPTIIHGYADDSYGEHSFGKGKKLSWDIPPGDKEVIRLSPVKAQIFINGWVETLLRVKEIIPNELNDIHIDWIRFFNRYTNELARDGLWRDITYDTFELLKAMDSSPKPLKDFMKSPQMRSSLGRLQLIMDCNLWENIDTNLLAEWVPGFDSIFNCSTKARSILEQKRSQLELLKKCNFG